MRNWLIEARKKACMSQREVAKAVHISQPSYCNLENGARSPSVDVAKRIAGVLEFDWTEFFRDCKENTVSDD